MRKLSHFFVMKFNLRKSLFFCKIERVYYFSRYYIFKFITYVFNSKNRDLVSSDIVECILESYPLIRSGMVSKDDLRVILNNLKDVLDQNIEGDIVELGCNVWTTSLFIRKLLDFYDSKKIFHVYDSFEWLPDKWPEDEVQDNFFEKGTCWTQKDFLLFNFKTHNLKLPEIHVGWFSLIPSIEYPLKISFAFFDGDFYSSITDSFNVTYDNLTSGAKVLVHDYSNKHLPGAQKAVIDFINDKPEKWTVIQAGNIGILKKL